MISKIISRAASPAECTSNPKSFFNCPDLHGGVPRLPELVAQKERLASLGEASIEFAHANNPIPWSYAIVARQEDCFLMNKEAYDESNIDPVARCAGSDHRGLFKH